MFCPNCGEKQFNNMQKNEYCCMSCNFIYFHNVAAAVSAIILFENNVLVTVRALEPGKGKLDLPGGFVDPQESLEVALSRELYEELGIQVTHPEYFQSFANPYSYEGIEYSTVESVFVVRLNQRPELDVELAEISDIRWIPTVSIEPLKFAFPSTQQALIRFFNLPWHPKNVE